MIGVGGGGNAGWVHVLDDWPEEVGGFELGLSLAVLLVVELCDWSFAAVTCCLLSGQAT